MAKQKIPKIIVYCVLRLEQKRVFQCIDGYSNENIRQIFIGLKKKNVENSKFCTTEEYSGFKIKEKILCNDKFEIRKLVSSLKPDVFVSGTEANFQKISLPKKCKKVFVSHGLIGNHIYDIKDINYSTWSGSDLYCGAGENFERFVRSVPGHKPDIKIILNAIPQFDIIYNTKDNTYKETMIRQGKIPKADKYILFAGFAGHVRSDFLQNNEDYYRTSVYLERLAKKNNWFVFIKPRVDEKTDKKFVKENFNNYANDYTSLWKSSCICMVHCEESIYKYFFSDTVIINGASTLEVEACCARKPLVIVRTGLGALDPFQTVSIGGAKLVKTNIIEDLEAALIEPFEKNIACYGKILKHHGISFDGKMSSRVEEAVLNLINEGT